LNRINLQLDPDDILPAYRHLSEKNTNTIEFLYGGRDSGKSYTIAQLLVMECVNTGYFRCALIREQFNTIKDSQWQQIKDVCERWDIAGEFTFNKTPLEIVFNRNGNKFICRGCEEPQQLKSITGCNLAWIEEGVKEREAFTIILTTLRSNDSPVRVFYTFNPECEGNYENFWLYEDWFADWWHPGCLGHSGKRTFNVWKAGVKKEVSINFRVTHTTYHDNPYVTDERIALHEHNKGYYYTVYTLGMWGYKITGGEFWTQFRADKHTADIELLRMEDDERNRFLPIHVSLDNNLNPYVTIAIWQVDMEEQTLRQYDELPCRSPDNSAGKAARKLIAWMRSINYKNVIFLYGDSTANAATTNDYNNRSFFDKFIEELEDERYHVVNNVGSSNPRVQMSGEFINEVMENGPAAAGWSIIINKKCAVSIEDYTMAKKDKDGSILKKRVTNKETGQTYEQYGHFSDAMRYFICTVLQDEYEQYADRGRGRRGVTYV